MTVKTASVLPRVTRLLSVVERQEKPRGIAVTRGAGFRYWQSDSCCCAASQQPTKEES